MEIVTNQFSFVARARESDLEGTVRDEVMPAVDTGPTRGGRVFGQALLDSGDGRYVWVVFRETVGGGSWYQQKIATAQERLRESATVYSTVSGTLLKSLAKDDAPSLPGIGATGTFVRAHTIRAVEADGEEQVDLAEVLENDVMPKLALHPANRVGHSTDGQAVFKTGDDSYLWLVNHTVLDSFSHVDTLSRDIAPAYAELSKIGGLVGFEEFRVLDI